MIKSPGEIDSSILVLAGSHCRLEWISEEGKWVKSHSFEYRGQLVERVEGEGVGNTMQSWRALRAKEPHLFRDKRVLVWQSPTAYVDSVIWAWQQDEETARFEPAVRMVDALATHWSEQSQHRNWLQQVVQC